YPEYKITPVVDVILAQKLGAHASAWPPYETRVVFTQAGALDAALRGVLDDAERVQRIGRCFYGFFARIGDSLSGPFPFLIRFHADGTPRGGTWDFLKLPSFFSGAVPSPIKHPLTARLQRCW